MDTKISGIQPSAREEKTRQNRQKLYDAVEQIMSLYDYNTVTIRNICKVSGVSYGSFYHLFDSKEAFLRFYLTHDFTIFMEQYLKEHPSFAQMEPLEKCVEIFVCCASYNMKKGLNFISSFYSTKNTSLFPEQDQMEQEYSFTPLVTLGKQYLRQAQELGQLPETCDMNKMICEFCYLFNGITFNWCLSQGKLELESLVREMMGQRIQWEVEKHRE